LHLETFISHTWFAFPCGGKLVFIDVFLSYLRRAEGSVS